MSDNKKKFYPEENGKTDFPSLEEDILRFWEDDSTFKKSVENREKSPEWVFYDGPPFANGLPHYGHILVSYIKDSLSRFQTMNGKKVKRRLGWDCHGLPAEMAAEKQLGISGRKAIEEYGIEKFNDFCRKDVFKYSDIWVDTFKRIGRWVDFDDVYRTMDLSFMESVIANFKALYDKGLIYEDYKVQPYSWAAQTPVSNFEVNQAYKDKTDTTVTVLFHLENDMNLMVWTTTPWTLPSNLMVAVGADIDYAIMQEADGKKYVMAQALLGKYKKELANATQVGTIKGKDLAGLSYEPVFPYFKEYKEQGCFKVLTADFVSVTDGTGIVHIAPGFGQDDFEACRSLRPDFPVICPVDEAGCFTADVPEYQGMQVFTANDDIIARLKAEKKLVQKSQITHSYPFCWRTDTPLIYKAMSGWFVKVTAFKDELIEQNKGISWTPDNVKYGRFGKGLESAPDWSISRNRFWGAPLPVWKSDNPDFPRIDVFGSIQEIKEKTGFEVKDLHRPYIDNVVYPNPDDKSGKTMMRRIPDVLDCWFESGSMPEGQIHYPFENKDWFKTHFPADFIVEGIDQTRGWFYSLHVLGTSLHHKPAFKNCLVSGLIMAENGMKLSKRLKNYPDPYKIINTMGSDALRWFFLSSPAVHAGNAMVDMEGKEIAKTSRKSVMPLFNAYNFFCLYANSEGLKANITATSDDVLDKYILAKTKILSGKIKELLEKFDTNKACEECENFLDILNNWYIRRSRARFWDGKSEDSLKAFDVLYTVLVNATKIFAPLMPFTAEYIYKNLTGEESVHLTDFPLCEDIEVNQDLIDNMDLVRSVCSAAKSVREEYKLRNRLPLATLTVAGANVANLQNFTALIKDEVNVKQLILSPDMKDIADFFLYVKTPLVGKRLGAFMKDILAASKNGQWQKNNDGTLAIAGQTLTAEEFELRLVLKDGMTGAALPDNTAVITLDINVTDELKQEGIARDFVRAIQNARKEANFNVSDRINIEYTSEDDFTVSAISKFADYIMEQTLTLSLTENKSVTDFQTGEVGDNTIKFTIKKNA